ncbi:acyl-coenzyme A thioesterase 13-like [Dermatophagoides farinae]|uniref:Acyl-coenzyme a thioesterase-like protein n=1 Tax=Dermatophagoides farinae TaxID=6954 RepID=A0A9D4P983_DERFA|nr:acyl-coenzyme a thioesterase-like protein [Dermatophagoides farinae]
MWQNRVINFFKASTQMGIHNGVLKNVQIVDITKGRIVADMPVTKECCNPVNYLHGGMSTTLFDVLSSMAIRSHFEADDIEPPITVSVELSMSFLAGVPEGRTVRLETETLRVGKKIAFLIGHIYDKETNKLVVTGKHTKFLM